MDLQTNEQSESDQTAWSEKQVVNEKSTWKITNQGKKSTKNNYIRKQVSQSCCKIP